MSGLLDATEPARTIIVEHGGAIVHESGGGTNWWPPLLVALAAAVVSYAVTWRFKKADVDRENALRAVDLVDEAEQVASLNDRRWEDEGGILTTYRRLQQARVRTQPLDDYVLDDRFQAALTYNLDMQLWQGRQAPLATGSERRSQTSVKDSSRISKRRS
jgi:hypothetical protein